MAFSPCQPFWVDVQIHYPDESKVGNGVYSVKMKIVKQIPNFLPALGLKIRINYRGCQLLCPNCYRVHPRRRCLNEKLTWIGYVHRFIQNNPKLEPQAYGRWWQIEKNEYPPNSTLGMKNNPKHNKSSKISEDDIKTQQVGKIAFCINEMWMKCALYKKERWTK